MRSNFVFYFSGFFLLGNFVESEKLWCYECNTDLSFGLKEQCNDPYAPGPAIDLISCPQHEPHHCMKALIFHKNVYATVRGCVPSRTRTTYCTLYDGFTEARVTCTFCNNNACNGTDWSKNIQKNTKILLLIIIISNLINYVIK